MDTIKNIITIDPGILGGQPVFKGTRVPVEHYFNISKKEFPLMSFLRIFLE